MASNEPAEPPPPYPGPDSGRPTHHSRLSVPGGAGGRPSSPTGSTISSQDDGHHGHDNGVPGQARASMEDEVRPLPEGWIRRFDANYGHHFYVDTRTKPPRSIWTHPYDEPEYHDSAPADDIGAKHRVKLSKRQPSSASTSGYPNDKKRPAPDGDSDSAPPLSPSSTAPTASGSGAQGGQDKRTFGRKLKDKMTNSTHDERVEKRRLEAEREKEAYERYAHVRRCFAEANRTGQRVLIGRDRQTGQEVYAEPEIDPYAAYGGGAYGGGGYGGYGGGYYGPPAGPYGRRGYGYGGPMGYGGPSMAGPLLGGMAGGLLLGGLLGGF